MIDVGEEVPPAEKRREIICRPGRKGEQCAVLHWASALGWNAQNRSAGIPVRPRVYHLAHQARVGESIIARTIEESAIVSGGMQEIRFLLRDANRPRRGRDFCTIGWALRTGFGSLVDVDLRLIEIGGGSTDIV